MGSLEFDKCCFCVDLKSGCFIIGYLSLIGYIGLAVICIVGLGVGGAVAAGAVSDQDVPDAQAVGFVIMVISAILLLFTVVLLTFIIVLLVGLHKNKPGHVKAYLIYACIYTGITTLLFIVSAVSGNVKGASIAQNIFSIVLSIYFILVIRSQYLVMKRPERGPAIYNTDPKHGV